MTREDQIKILESLKYFKKADGSCEDIIEALDMAIKDSKDIIAVREWRKYE